MCNRQMRATQGARQRKKNRYGEKVGIQLQSFTSRAGSGSNEANVMEMAEKKIGCKTSP